MEQNVIKKLSTLSGEEDKSGFSQNEDTFRDIYSKIDTLDDEVKDNFKRLFTLGNDAIDLSKSTREELTVKLDELNKGQTKVTSDTKNLVTNIKNKYDNIMSEFRNDLSLGEVK